MPTRPTNQQLAAEFRQLLTHGFFTDNSDDRDRALELTKPWRNELWKKFAEIHDRLEPTRQIDKERKR